MDEPEVLDWGNEDEEMSAEASRRAARAQSEEYGGRGEVEDAEDAVSLGGDDDEVQGFYAYGSHSQQDVQPKGQAVALKSPARQQAILFDNDVKTETATPSQKPTSRSQASPQHSPGSGSLPKLTHALPPKPVAASVPYLHPSHPSIIAATAMSKLRHDKDKKANGSVTQPVPADTGDSLPPDWEARRPSNGQGIYYYNVRTHESTWNRPRSDAPRNSDKYFQGQGISEGAHSRSADRPHASGRAQEDDCGQSLGPDMSYEDRHYRPGDHELKNPGKRDEQPQSRTPQRPLTPERIIYEREPSPVYNVRTQNSSSPATQRTATRPENDSENWKEPQWAHSYTADQVQAGIHRDQPRERRYSDTMPARRSSSLERYRNPSSNLRTSEDSRTYQKDVPSSTSSTLSPSSHLSTSLCCSMNSSQGGGRLAYKGLGRSSPPPPRAVERLPQPVYENQTVPHRPPGVTRAPRRESRFDRPARNAMTLEPQDDLVPDDILPRGDAFEGETALDGSRPFANRPLHDSARLREGRKDSGLHHSPEPSSLLLPSSEESREQKRFPLPPQSDRFREASMTRDPQNVPAPRAPEQGPREPGNPQENRSPHAHLNTDRRVQIQAQAQTIPRDAERAEPPRQLRVPPSALSIHSDQRDTRGTTAHHFAVSHDSRRVSRTDDAMDVDKPSLSEPLASREVPYRSYADRESRHEFSSDMPPRGPRAMTAKSDHEQMYRDSSPSGRMRSDRWGNNRGDSLDTPQPTGVPPQRMRETAFRVDDLRSGGPRANADWNTTGSKKITEIAVQDRSVIDRHVKETRRLSGTAHVTMTAQRWQSHSSSGQTSPTSTSPSAAIRPASEKNHVNQGQREPSAKELYERQIGSQDPYNVYASPAATFQYSERRTSTIGYNAQVGVSRLAANQHTSTESRPRRDSYRQGRDRAAPVTVPSVDSGSVEEPRIWMTKEEASAGMAQSPSQPAQRPRETRTEATNLSQIARGWQIPPLRRAHSGTSYPNERSYSQDPNRGHNGRFEPNGASRRPEVAQSSSHPNRGPATGPRDVGEYASRPLRRNTNSLEKRISDQRNEDALHSADKSSTYARGGQGEGQDSHEERWSASFNGRQQTWEADKPVGDATPFTLPEYQSQATNRISRPVRIRRPIAPSISSQSRDSGAGEFGLVPQDRFDADDALEPHSQPSGSPRVYKRPEPIRRPGSLLDRLTLDEAAATAAAGDSVSPSLRDRVYVPVKRDHDDMVVDAGDAVIENLPFDGDEDMGGDSGSKRVRKHIPKPRPKRGLRRTGVP